MRRICFGQPGPDRAAEIPEQRLCPRFGIGGGHFPPVGTDQGPGCPEYLPISVVARISGSGSRFQNMGHVEISVSQISCRSISRDRSGSAEKRDNCKCNCCAAAHADLDHSYGDGASIRRETIWTRFFPVPDQGRCWAAGVFDAALNRPKPKMAEAIEPTNTPIFTSSTSMGSLNARPPMNRLMVKPIPHNMQTP